MLKAKKILKNLYVSEAEFDFVFADVYEGGR